MLKKNGVYCFIQEYIKTGSLCILNGGSRVKLKPQRELEYYYEKLDIYTDAVQDFLDIFDSSLQEVSTFVRSFGGSGRIHGFIVDIDKLNHLYLNPFDGKITAYYATSISDKYVYKNIASLLRFRNKGFYNKYQKKVQKLDFLYSLNLEIASLKSVNCSNLLFIGSLLLQVLKSSII